MKNYTDQQLEALLTGPESDQVERKESFRGDAPNTVREAVCAFANDLPGHATPGVVFIGVRDDGTAAGVAVTDELLRALSDIKTDGNILPPPTLVVERRIVRGAELAVITVAPADAPPVRYRGRIWVRVGPRRGVATAQDERILNERRRYRDRPFDIQPVHGATLADLDLQRFEREYLPAAVPPDVLDANARTQAERLAALKMVSAFDAPVPTVLGVLVLGKNPRAFLGGAYVQFLRIQGTSLADPILDEQSIDGPLLDVARLLDEKLTAHNRIAVDFTSSATERRHPSYPPAALQQVTRNALLHRSYEGTNAPVRVSWFDDRIEVVSPGGPFGAVTVDNFGEPHLADYRNPNVAEAMRVLGLVQKFGAGIAITRATMRDNGNPPPEFTVSPSHVLVTLRCAP
ncbi:MAG: putative DNA binding domain-containing protein [Anaerolineae bacterium]|nr:putative DNA binding domain-containing protein [Anaerolineae bacterium]